MKSRPVTFTLVIAFVALIGILLGIGWLGLSRLELMNDNLQKITDRRWAKVQLARQALRSSTINSHITLQIPLLDDSQEIESLLEQRANNSKKTSELLKTIEAESESNTERALIAAVWTNRIPYVQSYERALSLLLKERQPAAARQMMAKEVTPNLIAYYKAWEGFVAFQGERMDEAGKDALAYYLAARRLVLLLLTLALILACAIAVFVTRETSTEIRNRLQAEQELREAHETLERRVEERTADLRQTSLEKQASEARLRAITNSAQDAVLMMDPEGKVSYWNPAAERILGYTNAEAIGQNLHQLIAPARYHKAHHAAYPAFLRTGQGAAVGKTLDLEACRKGGQEVSVQLSLSAVQINGGWHAVGIIRDTTERKQAELEIQRQATFARVNPNPVLELSAAGEINYSNDAAGEMARALGLEKPAQMLPPNTATMVRECLATGKPKTRVETQLGPRVLSWSFFPVKLNDTVHCYGGDITGRKRAEARVAAFGQLGQKLGAAKTAREAGDIIIEVADQLLKWDACTLDLYSPELDRAYHVLSRDIISGQRVECPPLEDEGPPSPRARRAIETGGQLYWRDEPADNQPEGVPFGDTAHRSASAMFVPIRDGSKVTGILSIQSYTPRAYNQDSLETLQSLADYCGGMLRRLRMQDELRVSEKRLRSVWEGSIDGMRLTDREGRIVAVNAAYCKLVQLPREKLEGHSFSVVYKGQRPGEGLEVYQQRFDSGEIIPHLVTQAQFWNSAELNLEMSSSFIELGQQDKVLFSIIRDITARVRIEARVAAFSQLGQKLSAANTALEAGDIILNVADQLIKWDACSLDLYSPELDRAYHVLNRDTINGQRVEYCPLKSEGPPSPRARQAIETGGQLYLRDEPVGNQLHGVPFGDTARPSASAMFVPIRDGSKVTGILSIQSYTPMAYNQDSLETLQALADYCGGTLGRLRMQEELRQEQTLMHALMETLPSHVYFKDTASRFLRINPAMAKLFGLSDPAQAVGKSDADFFAGEHVRQAFEDEQEIIRTGRPLLDIEEKETWPDGTETWVLSSKLPLRDGAGHIIGTCGVSSNVTARKRAEEALAQERHLLRTLIDNVPDYIYVKDTQSRFVLNNQAHLALLKVTTQAELVGKTDRDIFPPEEAARYYADEQAVFRSGEPLINREERTVDPAGQVRWLLTTKVPMRDEQGKTTRLVGVSHDITTRVEAEARLLETNRELEAATARANEMAARAELACAAKGEFLASMSHEIRTPMNGVMGMLGLLHDSELSDRQREFVQIAHSSADALLNIINDILDFSKIEAGKLTIEPIPFDLQTAVDEVGEILATKVAEKGLDLIVRFAPGTPRNVIGDPGRVRQVLTNLVGNAVKFTTAGHVLISVQCERQTEQQAQLRFSVEDTGIGIAADHLDHIFEKFTQADASTTRRFGGTGLGLAISKRMTELMGGSISVTSQPGKGSTFSVTLPFNLPSGPLPTAPPRTFLEGVRVLIVDDNEVNRRVLHEQVSSWRMRDDSSASGEEALTRLREAQAAGDPYHIAILDYQMPGMDGEMLARAITADPELRTPLLVMLTSLGHPTNANCLKEAGIFACLLKPVRQSKLWDALAEAWGAHTRQSPIQLPTRPTPVEPRPAGKTARKVHARVLVVDDNTTNQKVARLMLESLGCRVDLSANGREALELLELLPYDAVFMDCEMPEMDGYEATAEIRRRHAHDRHIPVIAMTAKAIQGDRERCLKAGMDDYISKPVRMEDLEAALARWIPGNEGVVPAGSKDLPPAVPDGAVATALDPAVTARLRELAAATDPSVLQEIYETFLSSAVDYLAAIRRVAAASDAEGLRTTAHALKGASANIGAQHLAELCRQLEALGEAKQVDGAAKRAEQLEQEFARVKVEIENQAGKKGAV